MALQACATCGFDNPAEARFCMSCGTALERACPSCGTPAPAEARFCMACGSALDGSAPQPSTVPAPPAPPALPEERRQVTVLFADLSGYTAVAERLDPETVKALVDRCLRRFGQEVERYGGTVDKYIGDNVMAVFGAPVAHEDDAERSIRAALAMQDAMREINTELEISHAVSFELRVGVNTGEVLAGAVGEAYTVIGDTVNVASRLQAAGRPGTVTVGPRTHATTSHVVEYLSLEPFELKGKAEPVQAFEVVGLFTAHPVRRDLARSEAPLVGRDDELNLLQSLYGRVRRERRPHLITLVGQAGVGKSRLLREFEQSLRAEGPQVFRQGRCLPYGSSIVYWPLGEVLRAECGIVDGDPSDTAWQKLSARLLELWGEGEEAGERRAALIGRLLGIDAPVELASGDGQDPQRMRETFFAAIRSSIEGMARDAPLVLAFEDIHWADQGMLDLIEHIAQWARVPVMILCLARDELLERRPGWGGGRRGATSIFLEPLTNSETRELIASLMPGEDANTEIVPAVAERAGGNPLFAEEMVRLLVDGGTVSSGELPQTVQALLAARLDSLEPLERRIVQHAAVVGRTFWEGALVRVAEEEGAELGSTLSALQSKDIFVPGEAGTLAGEPELAFKHVLIRDVAYGMLPKAVRARKHFEVGDFIEARAGDRTDEVVALLAEHYGRAATLGREARVDIGELDDMRARALRFLEAAGDAAASFFSNREAFAHYEAARELGGDEESAARIGEKQGDAALRLGRIDSAISVWGEALDHHRRQENLERVADLHRKIGAAFWHAGDRKQAIEHHQKGINLLKDGPPCMELVRLYEEAAWLYMQTGDNMLAIYASEKALRLAERLGETRAASRAHGIFGRVFGRIGDTERARENLERSVELARGSDEGETILALLALGQHLEVSEADYSGADAAYQEALSLAEQVGDVPAQVELHAALAWLAVYRADWDSVRASGEASAELSEREGLSGKLSLPFLLRGLLAWREGHFDEAEKQFTRSHELAEQAGWSEVAFSALFALATELRDRGDYGAAVTALAQGLDVCERAGLIAQSIQAISQRAVVLGLAGKRAQAREAAIESMELADRLHYPVARAAALEADGFSADPGDGIERLEQARAAWQELGRPLDAARCSMLVGRALLEQDPVRAGEALDRAAGEFAALGVRHLAEGARALVQG